MRIRRWISQIFFLSLFGYLFIAAQFPVTEAFPVEFFLNIDPFIALIATIAARLLVATMAWALILIILTLILGRFFCSYVCPLGALIDIADMFSRKKSKDPIEKWQNRSWWKFAIIIALLVLAIFQHGLYSWLDPIALLYRGIILAIYPFSLTFGNAVTGLFSHDIVWKAGLSQEPVISLFILGLILIAGIWSQRLWCKVLCPLGGMLGFFGVHKLQKRHVTDACTECMLCYEQCPMAAIEKNPRNTKPIECFNCQECAGVCPVNAIEFPLKSSAKQPSPAIDLSRRKVLNATGVGLGLVWINSFKPLHLNRTHDFIRPPGAKPETQFLATCERCELCIKACPTGILQPAVLESGMDGLWTPVAKTRLAGCEALCVACGQVCPTGAINELAVWEKRFARMGTAVIVRDRCLAWSHRKSCLVCDEACPYDAIEMRSVSDSDEPFERPFVLTDACTGCGICEAKCPVLGPSAIVITPNREVRQIKGPYVPSPGFNPHRERQIKPQSKSLPPFEYPEAPIENPMEELPPGFLP